MTRVHARREGDRGSISLETAILAPALIAFLLLIVACGRVAAAHSAVDSAAREAAREASLSRDPATAQSRAGLQAEDSLTTQNLRCTGVQVTVTTDGFFRPVGTPASTTVTVSCTVQLGDIALPGLPGAKTITSTFTSPLDSWRPRAASALPASLTSRANPGGPDA